MMAKGSSGEGFVGLGMEWPVPSNYSLTPPASPEWHAFYLSEENRNLSKRAYVEVHARVNWSGYDQLVHFRHVQYERRSIHSSWHLRSGQIDEASSRNNISGAIIIYAATLTRRPWAVEIPFHSKAPTIWLDYAAAGSRSWMRNRSAKADANPTSESCAVK